jgi:hypothetical protein
MLMIGTEKQETAQRETWAGLEAGRFVVSYFSSGVLRREMISPAILQTGRLRLMNKKARKTILAAPIAAIAIALAACSAQAAVLTDNFTTQVDYSGGAVQGIWSGSYNMPALAGGTFAASPTFADNGLLVVDYDANLGWEFNRSSAPFLYVDVPANEYFTAEVTIVSQTSGNWSNAGLIARAKQGTPPGTDADHADEYFTYFGSFRTAAANPNAGNTLHKLVEAGVQTEANLPIVAVGDEPLPIRLRLERTGANYIGSVSLDNGATWQVQSTRTATAGTPLAAGLVPIEVGLAFSSFDPALLGIVKFDNFRLETRPAPEPGAAALAVIGMASLAAYRKRRR